MARPTPDVAPPRRGASTPPTRSATSTCVAIQCWLLAQSFLATGFECVIIGSNGFHTPEEGLDDMVDFLLRAGDVYHVTLDPSMKEIQRRIAMRGSDFSPDSLAERVEWIRARYRGWTCRIHNTSMSPGSTLAAIAERIGRGDGRITGPLPRAWDSFRIANLARSRP